jgi:hypothetical protein
MNEIRQCILCDRNSDEVPLITFEFQGRPGTICSQHLPVLIHDPSQLIGRLPGAEALRPSDHQD